MPIRVCVAGVTGWTGSAVADAVAGAADLQLVAGVSRSDPSSYSTVAEALDAAPADVLVDYTSSAAVKEHVLAALDRRVAVVVGSSGLSAVDYERIEERAREQEVGVIAAGNFSITAALLLRFATEAARHVGSWEVIDYSSLGKPDAPSGTARARRGAPPSARRRCTRCDCRASASRPRLSSAARTSASRSATTPAPRPLRTSPARSSRFARSPSVSA